MNFCKKMRLGAVILTFCIILGTIPAVYAANDFELIFTNVSTTDLPTMSGEVKIMVSVSGVTDDVRMAQATLDFSGDLTYTSVKFLQGADDPDSGLYTMATEQGKANRDKNIDILVLAADTPGNRTEPMKFSGVTDLCILTFAGNSGDSVTLELNDREFTQLQLDNGKFMYPKTKSDETFEAIATDNQPMDAKIKLSFDKVSGFKAGKPNGASTDGVIIKLTNKSTGLTTSTVLNNDTTDGGHRLPVMGSTSQFEVVTTVMEDCDYDVEISCLGYKTYKTTTDFLSDVEVTNSELVPGDLNSDDKIDEADKTLYEKLLKDYQDNDLYTETADLNRDGIINSYDDVYGDIEGTLEKPAKMNKPTVTGGSKKVTVKWTKLSDETVKGYSIKYGTSQSNLNLSKEIDGADTTSTTITGLSDETTYYVAIAAKNEEGTGDYSEPANATTSQASSGLGGGLGGGGGAGGGGGGGAVGGTTTKNDDDATDNSTDTPVVLQPGETFTDLGNHEWAKDAIYELKDLGIISGISETEYAPANNIKRGDFILILTRMLGIEDEFDTNFVDVPADSYYYNAIGAAKAAGIAQGSGDTFSPENSITRQDLITLAYRAFLNAGYITEALDESALSAFADYASISDYARGAMASMVGAGIIQGSDGNVNPLGNATRAEVAVMCSRLVKLMQ